MTDAVAMATEYTVSLLPEETPLEWDLYAITVSYRGNHTWAVTRHRWCLGADGEWDFEPRPSGRDDEWLARHRFDLAVALRLAREQAPHVNVNGRTAAEVLAQWEADVRG